MPKLTPWEAQSLNLVELPGHVQPNPADLKWWGDYWLGPWGDSLIAVGVTGNGEDLAMIIEKYKPYAIQILFPYPEVLAGAPKPVWGQLLIVFTREGLKRAAHQSFQNTDAASLANSLKY